MSGQYPGQFGPPPGGTPYGPGGMPGAVPAPSAVPGAAVGAAPIPGRFGTPARVACAAAPLLTFGLLGAIPSLLLAVRRRRAYDVLGAVVFCALLLTMIVSAGISGSLKDPTADVTGQITLAVLWLTPTAHFLLMDRRAVWEAGRRPAPQAPYPSPYPAPTASPYAGPSASPYAATAPGPDASPYAGPSASPYAATAPGYGVPVPAGGPAPTTPTAPPAPAAPATPAPGTAHDLRELGDLLRRQAREDRP
ncbi:hypothetical protein ACFV0O_38935 [Kitasatospora sp. NPDC059577]|uniref:hypothetical protein n=1 Tax=unclassified Kitasatospora TaxID=2633591 RepID=UPI00368D9B80